MAETETIPFRLDARALEATSRRSLFYALVARVRDVVGAVVGLILLSPVLGVLAVASYVNFRVNPFFVHVRVGKGNKRFRVVKLRTLKAEAPTQVAKREAENLATTLGRFMRRYKLDEFPQLINVIKGDMSLVGPRPIIPEEYTDRSHYQRLAVRPGATGLWQLSRVREERFDRNPEYDLFYLANRSLMFDFWLLWRTLLLIFLKKETKIRLAARLWERDTSWRSLVPDRARAIGYRTGPVRSRVYAAVVVGVIVLASALSLSMAILARGNLVEGKAQLLAARDALRRLEIKPAQSALSNADLRLKTAEAQLNSFIAKPGSLVPGIGDNMRAATALARSAREMVKAGRESVTLLSTLPYQNGHLVAPWHEGQLDLAPFEKASAPATRVQSRVARAQQLIGSSESGLLIPSVKKVLREVDQILADARRDSDAAVAGAFLMPRIFGAEGKRTWILAAENDAEARGRGGYLGSFGIIEADQGKVSLGKFISSADLAPLPPKLDRSFVAEEYLEHYYRIGALDAWQNFGMSPNFPSGARLLLGTFAQAGGPTASGVVAMDPRALSYIMEVTGPVSVAGIPEPLSAANVVDWALNRIYFQFEGSNQARREALGDVAEAVWQKLLTGKDIDPRKLAEAIGKAASERHLALYSSDPKEQSYIESLGIGGEIKQSRGDYVLVVGQNVGENKMDYYLERDINYRGRLSESGELDANLRVVVHNRATPGQHIPDYVGGARPHLGLAEGSARTYLTVMIPREAVLDEVRADGQVTTDFDAQIESGRRLVATYVQIGAGESKELSFRYRVPHALVDGSYVLNFQHQATVRPDNLRVDIELPQKMEVADREGFLRGPHLNWKGQMTTDMTLSAELQVRFLDRVRQSIVNLLRRPIGG